VTAPIPTPAAPGDSVFARISEAARTLDDISDAPLADAAERLDSLHGELQSALADLDQN
jgi:hypothetical protein